ncbi:DDE superfamily endonuclease [Hirsutella rhossiliensis]
MPSHKGGAVRRAGRSQHSHNTAGGSDLRRTELYDDEDDAIAAYVTWLQRSGFPASKIQVESAALTLLQRRNPNAKPPGKNWYHRWLQDHPELRTTYLKAVEKSRKVFEANDVSYVEKFFSRLKEIISSYGIGLRGLERRRVRHPYWKSTRTHSRRYSAYNASSTPSSL